MAREYKRKTRKVKRMESFIQQYQLTPQQLLDMLNHNELPDNLRKKAIIKEAQDLV
jgi:hypothetical protein